MTTPVPSVVVSDDGEVRVLVNLDVLAWRYNELIRAGYDVDWAILLSAQPEIDLHVACDLLHNGATVAQAVAILT